MTERPVLRVVSGNPTPEEIAAILAVVSRSGGVREVPEPTKLTTWGDPRQHMRGYLPVGHNAWRQSAWAKY